MTLSIENSLLTLETGVIINRAAGKNRNDLQRDRTPSGLREQSDSRPAQSRIRRKIFRAEGPEAPSSSFFRASCGYSGKIRIATHWRGSLAGGGQSAGTANPKQYEVLTRLYESHVFILTSRYEGFPIAILEAMSMGLAVIASDVGGVREAVTPECGILIGRGDKEALKRALTRLAEDKGAIARYGAAARERAVSEFSDTGMCEKIVAVYKNIRAQ